MPTSACKSLTVYDRVLSRGELERKIAALDVIKQGAGTQFDPPVAQLFVQMMEKGKQVKKVVILSFQGNRY